MIIPWKKNLDYKARYFSYSFATYCLIFYLFISVRRVFFLHFCGSHGTKLGSACLTYLYPYISIIYGPGSVIRHFAIQAPQQKQHQINQVLLPLLSENKHNCFCVWTAIKLHLLANCFQVKAIALTWKQLSCKCSFISVQNVQFG